MKKLLVLLIALIAAGGSAYYIIQRAPTFLVPLVELQRQNAERNMVVSSMSSSESVWGGEDTTTPDAMSSSSAPSMASSATSVTPTQGSFAVSYAQYVDGVVGNGEASVLFFADTNELSRGLEQGIKAAFKAQTPTVNTYKVDFDHSDDLRKQYGVRKAGTLVLIDRAGKRVNIIEEPMESDIEAFLAIWGTQPDLRSH